MSSSCAPDVVVVGAGPAGLVSALACADEGLSVLVLDRRSTPIDKACGEGLMPDAVSILAGLGVALPEHRPILGIRYVDDQHCAEGRFGGRPGAGVRRPALHRSLLDRAAEMGVEVRQRVRVTRLRRSGGDGAATRWVLESDDGPLAPRWIIAADGLHSQMRVWSGLARPGRPPGPSRFGIRCHFRVAPWTDLVEVHWAEGTEAYVTPVASDEIGVAVLWTRAAGTSSTSSSEPSVFDRLLSSFGALAARLDGAETVSSARAAGPFRQRTAGVAAGNLALVGDASGYVDAITGEGMALAFHQAVELGTCLAAGDLSPYPAAHRRRGRVPNLFTEATLGLSRHPGLRGRALGALEAEPALFDRILSVHVGDARLRALASRPLASASRHFVTGH